MTLSELELQAFSSFEKAGWDRAADPYHHHWDDLSRQSAEPMLDAARVKNGSTLLDVATGAGYIAAAAANRGAHAIGLDFSQAQVELARSLYPYIEFRQHPVLRGRKYDQSGKSGWHYYEACYAAIELLIDHLFMG